MPRVRRTPTDTGVSLPHMTPNREASPRTVQCVTENSQESARPLASPQRPWRDLSVLLTFSLLPPTGLTPHFCKHHRDTQGLNVFTSDGLCQVPSLLQAQPARLGNTCFTNTHVPERVPVGPSPLSPTRDNHTLPSRNEQMTSSAPSSLTQSPGCLRLSHTGRVSSWFCNSGLTPDLHGSQKDCRQLATWSCSPEPLLSP